ncbi:MAG: CTP synthase, partial [Planctomycetes bacterium]|nr:CTP synthase [Planctomycetota bacterium]
MATKHIFVTGGVVSSLGKGLTCASIGLLLERRGLSVRLQKFDPYINVDPGTMSPFQHGEVYVLDDGAETDLDLGHYERFTNAPLNRDCNYTTGKIYLSVIQKERRGDYRGKTVQVIPHVTDEIKSCIRKLATPDVDVCITEIGGTVGDIEGLPYFEAIRQYALDIGKNNCMYIHLTLVPYLKAAGESKSKPTQHSVMELRKIGIQPDVLICRTERELPKEEGDKIALFCNVERRAVIEERDKDVTVYEVPLSLMNNKLDDLIVEKFNLTQAKPLDMEDWRAMIDVCKNPPHEVTIAVVGKYVKHHDAYKSVYESLIHAGIGNKARVHIRKIEAEKIEQEGPEKSLSGADALLVPGGFDKRGINGKIEAIRFAREHRLPFFGLCLGLQCATIEFARNVLKLPEANSTEFSPKTIDPVVCLLDEQRKVTDLGGTMRLGLYECKLLPGSKAHIAYGADSVWERHRHRYEFNNSYRERFRALGMIVSGTSPDGELVEVIELPGHPWFVAVQCHPEFKSKPTKAHPLFRDFVKAGLNHRIEKKGDAKIHR